MNNVYVGDMRDIVMATTYKDAAIKLYGETGESIEVMSRRGYAIVLVFGGYGNIIDVHIVRRQEQTDLQKIKNMLTYRRNGEEIQKNE